MENKLEIGKPNKILTKKFVSDLLKLSNIDDIEAGIVKYFLKKRGISEVDNRIINELLHKDKEYKVISYLQRANFDISIADIQKLFELIIDEEDKRVNGAVYTDSFIVNYIVSHTIDKKGLVCDCSCGSGAFLLGSLIQLKKLTNEKIVDIIEKYLYGSDIIEYSIRRAKIILSLFAILNGEDKHEIKFNLVVADSLEEDWHKLFPDIFKHHNGFDYVVGNPPYVRIQDLKDVSKEKLLKWESVGTGNYNLYFAFFELGSNILNDSGKLGYITPNNYFTSLAGVNLREYLTKKRHISRILNFNHLKIFENAQTYTCITFIDKHYNKEFFEYYYLEDKKELDSLNTIEFGKCHFGWLDPKKWRLMTETDFNDIKKIETIGTPLNTLCPIRVGIATLKDTIFFVEDNGGEYCDAEYKDKKYHIEKEITRPVIKISAIENEHQIIDNKRRIIFPYIRQNGKYQILSEEDLKHKYPKCYAYLLVAKEELETRDKGKKTYPLWFAWGRTQGMDFKGERLYTRTFYDRPDFMFDPEDNLFCNGYAVFCKKHVKAIQKILNSKIMEFYIKKTSVEIEGNYQCYQKNFIEKFSIPEFTDEEWSYIEKSTDVNKLNSWLISKYNISIR